MTDFATRRRQPFMSESLYATTRPYQLDWVGAGAKRRTDGKTLAQLSDAEGDFRERFDLWKLDYTAGVPLEELAPQLSEVVDAFEQWEAVNVEYRKERRRINTDIEVALEVSACELDRFDHYQELIQLVGAAILLRDARSVKRIVRALKFSRRYDELFETLVRGYLEDPQDDIDGVEHEKPWRILMDAYYQDDEPERILACINKFCKAWYPAMKGLPWHDAHKRIMEENGQEHGRYYGYWAFEAGAVAYLLDVDDSSIEHMVYPKDLVAYGRALRERDAWTSPDEPLEKPILVKTGQPAPHSGLYAAFDGLAAEVKLNQGELLPTAEDLMDPKRPNRAFTWILRQRSDGGPVME